MGGVVAGRWERKERLDVDVLDCKAVEVLAVWKAFGLLKAGALDVKPEYLGTDILHRACDSLS